ncbi:MAG: hypothetical protein HPY71_13730 [Firmicutes bacterium]|jgi:hypothetical protein|nr:hypothetical protein [Bacillota bacterium]
MAYLATLTRDGQTYYLSDVDRSFDVEYIFLGAQERSVSGKLVVVERARKRRFSFSWDYLTYDTAPDGGIGLSALRGLVLAGGTYTLELRETSTGGVETIEVVFMPERFKYDLAKLTGLGRALWKVDVVLEEV